MANQPQTRSSQRTVLACTECVRRKIRCSKSIPCDGCVRQNKASLCRREPVALTARRSAPRSTTLRAKSGATARANTAAAESPSQVGTSVSIHDDVRSGSVQIATGISSQASVVARASTVDTRIPETLALRRPSECSDREHSPSEPTADIASQISSNRRLTGDPLTDEAASNARIPCSW
ncbi:predicted protein, partial [Verticillium alfalfae VaMs.102]